MDKALFFTFYGDGQGMLTWLMIALTVLGNGWIMIALGPLIAVKRTRMFAGWLLLSLLTNTLAVFVIKSVAQRPRPCFALPGVHAVFFDAPLDPSFPSGHAAGSFCFAAFCITLLWGSARPRSQRVIASAALLLIASGIALSRVYLGVHYPLDIAAGALLGTLLGRLFGLRARAMMIRRPA